MRKSTLFVAATFGILLVIFGTGTCTTYNRLVTLDQNVKAQWAQVENVYQRRYDLVPNLVETVKGAAAFEKDTFTAVTEARSRVGQVNVPATSDATRLREFQEAQDQLGRALSRLLVVAERYPELKATQNFRDLQAQLEGTENRIAVERMRYNEAAREFNAKRNRFPAIVFAGLFGARFADKAYFEANRAAAEPPKVDF